ncbi:hypothetical protein J7T55_005034 [Diaporthe amygdali]|uniref:uncharacterized protein n=1 Tax=Phomopsis amygdali TaxID=1214568 RepID=UPI0022FECB56|nr:uncharacterized protein J7T55_005034 [Diaporthe amygdali]KAJ0116088.1 hypothetical protein J7T55_005034 [Diaporthe amygdali]
MTYFISLRGINGGSLQVIGWAYAPLVSHVAGLPQQSYDGQYMKTQYNAFELSVRRQILALTTATNLGDVLYDLTAAV